MACDATPSISLILNTASTVQPYQQDPYLIRLTSSFNTKKEIKKEINSSNYVLTMSIWQ